MPGGWTAGNNRLKPWKQAKLISYLRAGYTLRMAAKIVGCHKETARTYADIFGRSEFCPCGKPVKHRGWCQWRFSLSESRQKFIKNWKPKKNRRAGWIIVNGELYPPEIAARMGRAAIGEHELKKAKRSREWKEKESLKAAERRLWKMRWLLQNPEALQSLRKESKRAETSRS